MFQIVLLESLSDFTKPVKQYVTIQQCQVVTSEQKSGIREQ